MLSIQKRSSIGLGIIAAVVLTATFTGVDPAGSQAAPVNHLTVRKVVVGGPVPADAQFTLHIGCTDESSSRSGNPGVLSQTLTFPAQGGEQTFDVPAAADSQNGFVLCGVEETAGAPPVTDRPPGTGNGLDYSCTIADPGTATPPDAPAPTCGSLRTEIDVRFPGARVNATAVVEARNWFVEPTPKPESAPAFTG